MQVKFKFSISKDYAKYEKFKVWLIKVVFNWRLNFYLWLLFIYWILILSWPCYLHWISSAFPSPIWFPKVVSDLDMMMASRTKVRLTEGRTNGHRFIIATKMLQSFQLILHKYTATKLLRVPITLLHTKQHFVTD